MKLLSVLLLAMCGCTTLKKEPMPEDTIFDESKRDWVATFEREIKTAMDNDDEEAYHFFMHELLKEKVRIWKEEQKNNP
tara:strand:- start:218 stop:454 length:237 start_codon:yes stop_codon:yes gene_type:complete